MHLCVDMQRLFAELTDWHTPWMTQILPAVRRITEEHVNRTIFTRFIPAERPGEGHGLWKKYYERWPTMTVEQLGPEMLELVPDLAAFVPPAFVIDKHVYSPWLGDGLQQQLKALEAETLIVTGGETDLCVLATVLGAVDYGYRVIVVTDALCSSSDTTHDSILRLYSTRFGQQVETATTEELLLVWPNPVQDKV